MATLTQDTMIAAIHRTTRVKRVEHELGEGVFGGIVGAVTGAIAGPPGIVVGAVVGFLVGLLAGFVAEQEDARAAAKTRRLDDAIGVTHGSMGTLWVKHMPARIGAYSVAASGAGNDHRIVPVEGPLPEDDNR
jgi:hypothetical protein